MGPTPKPLSSSRPACPCLPAGRGRQVIEMGIVVVSRLRKDSALDTLPEPRPAGRRGRRRIYGKRRIDLAKRAGHRRGWQTGTFVLYGKSVVKRYKTFLATWRPVPACPCLPTGRGRQGRGDPSGVGGRTGRLACLLLHRPRSRRGRHPGLGGGPACPCLPAGRGRQVGSAWRRASATSSKSWERVSNKCETCGRMWDRFICACGPSP